MKETLRTLSFYLGDEMKVLLENEDGNDLPDFIMIIIIRSNYTGWYVNKNNIEQEAG